MSRKKKAYIAAALALVGILAWAFISAGIITHNFNRSQLTNSEDRQEAQINGIILTEDCDVIAVHIAGINPSILVTYISCGDHFLPPSGADSKSADCPGCSGINVDTTVRVRVIFALSFHSHGLL